MEQLPTYRAFLYALDITLGFGERSVTCWMCGKPAQTGEHKTKRSLLTALHGKGPYKGASAVAHVKDGKVSQLQGPDSRKVKYGNSLCAGCNNKRSQPFDFAFDKFFRFVIANENDILKYRIIDFHDVYGDSFEAEQTNLYKYYVKLFGCNLAAAGYPVPDDLKILLDETHFLTRLRISFAVNEDKLLMSDITWRSTGIGALNTSLRNQSQKDDPKYRWHTFFSCLHTYYCYDIYPDGPFGAMWVADSRYLYLGSFHPLTAEQRAEFLSKLQEDTDAKNEDL